MNVISLEDRKLQKLVERINALADSLEDGLPPTRIGCMIEDGYQLFGRPVSDDDDCERGIADGSVGVRVPTWRDVQIVMHPRIKAMVWQIGRERDPIMSAIVYGYGKPAKRNGLYVINPHAIDNEFYRKWWANYDPWR